MKWVQEQGTVDYLNNRGLTFDDIYPIGTVYISVGYSLPTYFSQHGTWKRISDGKYLLSTSDSAKIGKSIAGPATDTEKTSIGVSMWKRIEPGDVVTVTFIDTDKSVLGSVEVDKGTAFGDIENKPSATSTVGRKHTGWSIDDDTIISDNVTAIARYSVFKFADTTITGMTSGGVAYTLNKSQWSFDSTNWMWDITGEILYLVNYPALEFITVALGEELLTEGVDYTLSYTTETIEDAQTYWHAACGTSPSKWKEGPFSGKITGGSYVKYRITLKNNYKSSDSVSCSKNVGTVTRD